MFQVFFKELLYLSFGEKCKRRSVKADTIHAQVNITDKTVDRLIVLIILNQL